MLAGMDDVRAIATEHLVALTHRGGAGRVNRDLVRGLGDTGVIARMFPSRLGGSADTDVSATTLCLLRETLATVSTEIETTLAMQGLGAYPILQSGSAELAERWIPRIVRGEAVPAFALTEPDAGSDAAALSLAAEPDGDGWRLSGVKTWISNAPDADVYTVFARTGAEPGSRGVSAFCVAGDSGGLGGEPLEMLSPHALGSVTFDGVRAERADLLGEEGAGFRVAMRTLDLFRPSVGAFAVGMAQAALDAAIAHAKTRQAFGKPIAAFQAVSHQLAEMATRLHAARLLVYGAAAAYDEGRGEDVTAAAAMAKLFATETAQFVVDAAVQIHGARALESGHLLEQLYRDVRAPRIYEGTSEIQRTIIARELYREVERDSAAGPA
jgi:alkylation response protein AidB-like acyl-CoA dehydrogenase